MSSQLSFTLLIASASYFLLLLQRGERVYHLTPGGQTSMSSTTHYHYRGHRPGTCGDGKPTKLARHIENENSLSQAEKYCDLYIVREEVCNGKRQPVLHCLVYSYFQRFLTPCNVLIQICDKPKKCGYTSNGKHLIFKNFFNHLQSVHPQELTPSDQEKAREKDDSTEKVSRQLKIGEPVTSKPPIWRIR